MTLTMQQHLRERGYDLERYPTTWLTETSMTVPLFDFDGKLKGYQTYTPDAPKKPLTNNPKEAKYFTRMMGHGQLVWGTELELAVEYEINNQQTNNRILN